MGKLLIGFINALSGIFFENGNEEGEYESHEPYEEYIAQADNIEVDEKNFTVTPLISVVLYETDRAMTKNTVESLKNQTYKSWELIIVSDESRSFEDSRIHLFKGQTDIARGADSASGDYIIFMNSGDELREYALSLLVQTMCEHPQADAFYSDEDIIKNSIRTSPTFKPDYAPDNLLSHNYIGRMFAVTKQLYNVCGGLSAFDPASEFDYVLRACDEADEVVHIPNVLYSRFSVPKQAESQHGCSAVNNALAKKGINGFCTSGLYKGSFHAHYLSPKKRRCEIIVFGVTDTDSLINCLETIEDVTDIENYGITVISCGAGDTRLIRYENALTNNSAAKVMRFSPDTSFAAACNACALSTTADMLTFLSCDTVPLSPDWLESMAELCERRDVGTVSPLVVTRDERTVSAGNVVGLRGWWDVPYYMEQVRYSDARMNHIINTQREVSLSNMDCFMISNDIFSEINGFDESFNGRAAIVELCTRLMWKHRRNIYTPFVKMLSTPHSFNAPDEEDMVRSYDVLRNMLINGDRYFNINYDPALIIPTVAKSPYQAVKLNPMQEKTQ